MALTKSSKIKEAWRNPVGHSLLRHLLGQLGRSESWLRSPLVANAPLSRLDKLAGVGFSEMLVEMAANAPERRPAEGGEAQAWWKEAVVYQLYLPSFMDSDHDGVGDIAGVLQRLPYLANLGVDVLWIWPFLPQAGQGGVTAYDRLGEDAGTMEDLENLLEQAHERGMRVVMGLDVTSTSREHDWFAASPEEARASYILIPGTEKRPPNNWTRSSFASAWTWYPELKAWGLHLNTRSRIDLNWDNDELRQRIVEALKFWAGKGIDGFGLSPLQFVSKSSYEDGGAASASVTGMLGYEKFAYGPRLHRYMRELRAALPESVMLAGELRGVDTEMAKAFTEPDRSELDMALDSGRFAALGRGPRGEDGQLALVDLKNHYLRWMRDYANSRWMPIQMETFQGTRIISRLSPGPVYRSIVAKLLAMMMLTLRGTPIIYQGQELGIANTNFLSPDDFRDPSSLRLYRDMCEKMDAGTAFEKSMCFICEHVRTPMPWNNGPASGFTGAQPWLRLPDGSERLNAAVQMEDPKSIWRFYRDLIALRKTSDALVYGSFNPVFANNKKVFCYFRMGEGEKWYVEMNLTERQVPRPGKLTKSQTLVASNYDTLVVGALRPYEANLYRCE